MKLIVQRTLGEPVEGPFWLESAIWDEKLHGIMRLTHGHASYEEGRFGPGGEIFWTSDESGTRLAYRGETPVTTLSTFKIGFDASGQLVSLQCNGEWDPYRIVRGGEVYELDSSVTHLERVPDSDRWVATSLEQLYRGPLENLQSQGPTSIRTFSLDPEGSLWYTARAGLYRDKQLIFVAEESLDWPLWTPRGVLVTQWNDQKSSLLVVQDGQKSVLWSGEGEWVRATAWKA
ncbi:MAG: hypothetical protein KF760_15515 [Candidatus Eremiobacteraeota bacterium]|nr:hypothetical protein [Candidatus Eremiobacteraeota bacterium]MCW5869314.1 hypothetical protein [Candidatus Eremiobacteraeota bacterium]